MTRKSQDSDSENFPTIVRNGFRWAGHVYWLNGFDFDPIYVQGSKLINDCILAWACTFTELSFGSFMFHMYKTPHNQTIASDGLNVYRCCMNNIYRYNTGPKDWAKSGRVQKEIEAMVWGDGGVFLVMVLKSAQSNSMWAPEAFHLNNLYIIYMRVKIRTIQLNEVLIWRFSILEVLKVAQNVNNKEFYN